MDGAPSCIDHTVVGMALEGSGPDAVLGMLMHDVGDRLVPPGDAVLEMDQHLGFLDHLAALCARFWGWRDPIGLTTMAERLRFFAPDNIAPELARQDTDEVLSYASLGWDRLAERDPATHALLTSVHERPQALCRALATTPVTFLQGDWKLGNLGSHATGARSCSTGPTRGPARPAGTSPGSCHSTVPGCLPPRRTPSPRSRRHCTDTGSTPTAGSTGSCACACSE